MFRKKVLFYIFLLLFLGACSIDGNNPSSGEKITPFTYEKDTHVYEAVKKETSPTSTVTSAFVKSSSYTIESVPITKKDYWVTNPTSESKLDVSVYQPSDTSKVYPAVILVPGGLGKKDAFLAPYDHEDGEESIVEKFVSVGFTVLIFSVDGRGNSEGNEDYNGYISQNGLYEMYRFLKDYEHVDKTNIGIVSYSYGVAMASGMLGRYQPELVYYIEWEGPVDRLSIKCDMDKGVVKEGITCDDEDYWVEREAMRFAPYFAVDHFFVVLHMLKNLSCL